MTDLRYVNSEFWFPHPNEANEDGLLAYGGTLTPNRLITAYRKGIFPWYSPNDPILWWSPDPRFVLMLEDFKVSKSLRKRINSNHFEVKFNTNFSAVIRHCSTTPRGDQNETWLVSEMIEAYETLHKLGYAVSVESYFEGKLVGGLYGVVIDKAFFGESMFSLMSDASKVALVALVETLKEKDFTFIDSQIYTPHLERFGAKHIARDDYLALLQSHLYM
jgi:leucyl/phenylalanyl-tRNA--protein transferase